MGRAEGSRIGTAIVVVVAAAVGAWLVEASYESSREPIAAQERAALVARLNSVLDPALRGRDLTTARVAVADEALLGTGAPMDVFVVRDGASPVATVVSVVAPHGYNSAIHLLVGISPDGVVTGARAVRHRETAGLGDAIDSGKSDWILQFNGRSLAAPERGLWALRQDDGEVDAIAGATVTSRAVVASVKNALLYFEQHAAELYAAAELDSALDDDGRH
jgi:electron transport complex protein RnfG